MKKIMTATILVLTTAAFSTSFANEVDNSANNNLPNQPLKAEKRYKKDLNLTASQAQTLVEAKMIQHDKDKSEVIQKTEIIKLQNDKTFYLVYVGKTKDSPSDVFFIVDAQNAKVMVFPHPKFKKMGHKIPPQFMPQGPVRLNHPPIGIDQIPA